MKFACLVYIDAAKMASLDAEGRRKLTDDTIAEDWGLRRTGQLVLAQPLEDPATAVTIRPRAGDFTSTDGPFVETKEHLGGFFIIEAPDIAEAKAIAARSPILPFAAIEIRPCLEQTHSRTGQGRPPATEV